MADEQSSDDDDPRTIVLGSKDVLAARRLLHLLMGATTQAPNELGSPPSTTRETGIDRQILIERASQHFHDRRRRYTILPASMFGEPAWDMLLALYIHDLSGQRQTIGSLLQFSGTSLSTAKRWLSFLADHDLVRRDDHPTDLRTAFLSLTPKAREKLDMYFSETLVTNV